MKYDLDVHVLSMDYTNKVWFAECLDSIYVAMESTSLLVSLHILPGVVGHLGQARKNGYALGEADYVTSVDDDDFIDANAFHLLEQGISQRVEAITTGERQVIVESGAVFDTPKVQHHLAVYRRDVLKRSDYSEFKYHPDQRLLSQVKPLHVPTCAYNCRIYNDSGSRIQRRANSDAALKEMNRVKNTPLFFAEAHTPAQIALMLEKEI